MDWHQLSGPSHWPDRFIATLEEGFVTEDAVESRTADGELTGGAELVAAIEVKDVLDVMADDGVEGEAFRLVGGLLAELSFRFRGQGKIAGKDDAIVGFEECSFKNAGEFANISWPVVLKETRQGSRAHEYGALLVAGTNAVEQGLGERGNVFAALT